MSANILLSVIVPVYNEEESLGSLFERLIPVLDGLDKTWEAIFVNDGSRDASLGLLLREHQKRPDKVKILDLNGNFGQHMALMAAFRVASGEYVITMDADLQNPPEEIPRILEQLENGHDVVGTIRARRRDSFFRKTASKIVNRITNRITGLSLHDYGCMLRGYRRDIIEIINAAAETTTFIPALAQKFAVSPIEIEVGHSGRERGESKYSLFRLIRLNFDLMTGFSTVPLEAVTLFGIIVSVLSFLFAAFMFARRLWIGPEAEGVFTLLAINFLLMGVTIFCVGIAGEYIGRIYQEIRHRPRYVVRRAYGLECATLSASQEHQGEDGDGEIS